EGLADQVDVDAGLAGVRLVGLPARRDRRLPGGVQVGELSLLALLDAGAALGRVLAGHDATLHGPAVAGQRRLGLGDAERVRALLVVLLLDRRLPLVTRRRVRGRPGGRDGVPAVDRLVDAGLVHDLLQRLPNVELADHEADRRVVEVRLGVDDAARG